MPHSGAAISENPAGMSPPLTTIKRERNSLEELINFGLWKAGRRTSGLHTCLRVAILVYIGIRYDASTRILYIQTFIQQI